MLSKTKLSLLIGASALMLSLSSFSASAQNANSPDRGTIYITSTGETLDTIALNALPSNGPFQDLYVYADGTTATTEFGPGSGPGHYGGRWHVILVDADGNETSTDTYFLCPLLGSKAKQN